MLFAEASETAQSIQAVFTGLGMLLAAWIAYRQWVMLNQTRTSSRKLDTVAVKQEIAAAKATEARDVAVSTKNEVTARLDNLTEASAERTKLIVENTEITRAIHHNTNGPRTALIRQNAKLARRIAELTRSPVDIRLAEAAEELLREAESRQANGEDSGIFTAPKPADPPASSRQFAKS